MGIAGLCGAVLGVQLGLVALCEWLEARGGGPLTDVDYRVFGDAARHVLHGRSPFRRQTYRYSPLVAYAMVPSHLLFAAWGKLLFVVAHVAVGWLQYLALPLAVLDLQLARASPHRQRQPPGAWGRLLAEPRLGLVLLWLANPVNVTVSVRGSLEAVIALCVMLSVYAARRSSTGQRHWVVVAALALSLAVHLKIYPVLYVLPLCLYLGDAALARAQRTSDTNRWLISRTLQRLLTADALLLGALLVATQGALLAWFYTLYGQEFLDEAYLYHISRRDNRHNFSLYFYHQYLTHDTGAGAGWVGLVAFGPQALLAAAIGLTLYRDLEFCLFLQTAVFVTFNKVCTSQYFLWYLVFLPFVAARSTLPTRQLWAIGLLWLLGQAAWLAPAYLLEFRGVNTFELIWLASVGFFGVNCWALVQLIRHRGPALPIKPD